MFAVCVIIMTLWAFKISAACKQRHWNRSYLAPLIIRLPWLVVETKQYQYFHKYINRLRKEAYCLWLFFLKSTLTSPRQIRDTTVSYSAWGRVTSSGWAPWWGRISLIWAPLWWKITSGDIILIPGMYDLPWRSPGDDWSHLHDLTFMISPSWSHRHDLTFMDSL